MIPRDDISIGNLTHVGRERTENQDYYGYYEPEDDREFRLKGRLIVVCDGMGGHAGGEIASRLAVNIILKKYKEDQTGNVLEALGEAIKAGNRAVWERSQQDPHLKGMGSTCTAMVLKNGIAYFGHVGDSRAYLLRNGEVNQLTKDHSLVQQMVDEGLLAENEMENHPEKNVILRSMGVKPNVEVDLNYQTVEAGDGFLLCSDGLSGLVTKEDIRQIAAVEHKDEPMEACSKLVDLANQNGGYDNITVQIVRVNRVDKHEEQHSTTTQMFSAEDVEASVAQAQASLETGKPAEPIPSAPTGEAQSAPASPAMSGTTSGDEGGGGKWLVLSILLGVVALILPLILLSMVGSTAEAIQAMQAEKVKAIRSGAPSTDDAFASATEKENAAWDAFDGLLGPITAGGSFSEAKDAYSSLVQSPEKGQQERAKKIRQEMLAAKKKASKVKAKSNAANLWHKAVRVEEKGQAAFEQEDYTTASGQFREALAQFQQAHVAAATAIETDRARKLQVEFTHLQKKAQDANVHEHWTELYDRIQEYASTGIQALEEGNVDNAIRQLTIAVELLRESIPKVRDFEKKKVKKVSDAARSLRKQALAVNAEEAEDTKTLFATAEKALTEGDTYLEQDARFRAIRCYETARDNYRQALERLGMENQRARAETAVETAAARQKEAEKEKASVTAPNDYHKGVNALSAARKAFEAADFDTALKKAYEASEYFTAAIRTAQERGEKHVQHARQGALEAKKKADAVDAKMLAHDAYEKAVRFMKEADREESNDPEKAVSLFAEAKNWFDTAREKAAARIDDPELAQLRSLKADVKEYKEKADKAHFRYSWGKKSEDEARRAQDKGNLKQAILHLKDALKHYKAASRKG